jgi:hypothetical protein
MIPLPQIPDAVPKVHPLDREMLPEDPLEMQAFEVPGDTELMFRIVIEEFARMGWDKAAILATARDPFYAALHGLLRLHGEEEFSHRVSQILARVGVIKVRTFERPPASDLMQIETSSSS